MDAVSRRAWELNDALNRRAEAQAADSRTQYAIQVGSVFVGRTGNGQHWAGTVDAALTFDHMTTAELYAFGRLDMGADEFRVVPV